MVISDLKVTSYVLWDTVSCLFIAPFPDNGVKAPLSRGTSGRENGVAAAEGEGSPGKDSAARQGRASARHAAQHKPGQLERAAGAWRPQRSSAGLGVGWPALARAGSGSPRVQLQQARARQSNRTDSPDVLEASANSVIFTSVSWPCVICAFDFVFAFCFGAGDVKWSSTWKQKPFKMEK